jgi:hypothetical protein
MNENDIYKLKYYKYKNKYLELKNRYNQEGGESEYYAFFLNESEFNKSYKVNNSNNALLPINSATFYYPNLNQLKKLPGLKAIIKDGQTIGEAFFPTLPKNKCGLSTDKTIDKTTLNPTLESTNNVITFFNKVNDCAATNAFKANLCLVFQINYGRNELISVKKISIT